MRHLAENLVEGAITRVDVTGIEVTPVTSPGGAAPSVLERSATASLVVIGSRGRGTLERLLLGSVATQVVHHASCSVAVIP